MDTELDTIELPEGVTPSPAAAELGVKVAAPTKQEEAPKPTKQPEPSGEEDLMDAFNSIKNGNLNKTKDPGEPVKKFNQLAKEVEAGKKTKEEMENELQQKESDEEEPGEAPAEEDVSPEQELPKAEEAPVVVKTLGRDYSGLSETDAALAKKMSKDAFERFRAVLLKDKKEQEAREQEKQELEQLKKGVKGIPPSYIEHEDAYTLSPDFRNLTRDTRTAQQIYQHWRTQLARVEQGESWQDLNIDAEGKLVISEPKDFSAEAKVEIIENLTHARQQLNNFSTDLQQVRENFTKRRQTVLSQFKTIEEKFFPQFNDEKFPGWELAKNVLSGLAKAGLDKSPLASMLAKSAASNTLLMARIKELEAAQGVKKPATDATKAQPTQAAFTGGNAGTAKPKAKQITIDDFNNLAGTTLIG